MRRYAQSPRRLGICNACVWDLPPWPLFTIEGILFYINHSLLYKSLQSLRQVKGIRVPNSSLDLSVETVIQQTFQP